MHVNNARLAVQTGTFCMFVYKLHTACVRICLYTLILLAISACSPASEEQTTTPEQDTRLNIYTVNYPLAWMAERLGGNSVNVTLPVPADVDPAMWRPTPEIISQFQQADLILLNGAGYASWIPRVSLPTDRLLNTSAAFSARMIPVTGAVRHKHGPAGEHSHDDVAFTVWLDPELAGLQAASILNALIKARPEQAAEFQQNFTTLKAELDELNARLKETLAGHKNTLLVFSHPVYQYLEQAYGLEAQTVLWEPDKVLTEKQLAALPVADSNRLKLVIWEAAPLPDNLQKLQTLGFTSIVFNPTANRPTAGDYLDTMRANLLRLETHAQ
jgi:zinc transport system substrate-binding protein